MDPSQIVLGVQTAFRPCSDCVQTVFRPYSERVQTVFRLCSDRVQTVFKPCSNRSHSSVDIQIAFNLDRFSDQSNSLHLWFQVLRILRTVMERPRARQCDCSELFWLTQPLSFNMAEGVATVYQRANCKECFADLMSICTHKCHDM